MMANVPVKFLFEVSNNIGQYKMQTADRVQNADCTHSTKCRLTKTFFMSETCLHSIL